MEIYVSSLIYLFIYFSCCIQLILLNSKYLLWVKLYICVCTSAESRLKCWHCPTEPSISKCVLFVLFLLFFFFLTENHNLWFIFCEVLYLHSPIIHFIDCNDCFKESVCSFIFQQNLAWMAHLVFSAAVLLTQFSSWAKWGVRKLQV